MTYNDFDLMQMQVEALFVHDADGKLLRINEPDPTDPAARFFLGRTAAGNVWRTRYDLPVEVAAELERLAASEPVGNLLQPPIHAAAYAELLGQHNGSVSVNSGPAYYLPASDVTGKAVIITSENINLMQTYFPWLYTNHADYVPVTAIVVDGNTVAVCFCSRITAKVAEAGVYTEEAYRGHGYASEAVRAWAEANRSMGRLSLYSTSWSNLASQAIAKKMGAVFYGADYSIT